MTEHDTWATLIPKNPLREIMYLFPEGQIPMRDPFPMELAASSTGKAALFTIDMKRLKSTQLSAIATVYAHKLKTNEWAVCQDALNNGGFAINFAFIEKIFCGSEGYQRTKELADFYDRYPEPTQEQFIGFVKNQKDRWIFGNEVPEALPTSIEEFDSRLISEELENSLEQHETERFYSQYSVFDILTGRAMVNYLNKNNPDVQYELVELEDLVEDE